MREPCPDCRRLTSSWPDPAKARIIAEVERRHVSLVHPPVLKRIMLNPVPKGQTYE